MSLTMLDNFEIKWPYFSLYDPRQILIQVPLSRVRCRACGEKLARIPNQRTSEEGLELVRCPCGAWDHPVIPDAEESDQP